MSPNTLCRERLRRLLAIVDRQGGSETLRQLSRRFGFHDWEVEQAAALGWLKIETRRPRVGRPSRIAVRLSKTPSAKLPPFRGALPTTISPRHFLFALRSVNTSVHRGAKFGGFCLRPTVEAYRDAFPRACSRNGAAASCSRLLRHPTSGLPANGSTPAQTARFPKNPCPKPPLASANGCTNWEAGA